jgi:hypothetical protein
LGKISVHIYDLIIVIPIGIEKLIKNKTDADGTDDTSSAKLGGAL